MYTVIGLTKSRTLRVTWMLEEMGEPYRHVAVNPHTPEVTAHNPSGKIPVLLDGDLVITDSTAILTYLADRHGALTHPPGTPARARQDSLTLSILDELEGCIWMAARHSFILPEQRRVPQVKDSLKWEFARNLDRLAARIEGPFLMGETMTVPDILAGHCALWARIAKFPLENDAFGAYAARLHDRPAFRRAAALP